MVGKLRENIVKIICIDPAVKGDPTGIIGVEAICGENKINVRLAKQLTTHDPAQRLTSTSTFLKKMISTVQPDFLGIELNNCGVAIKKKLAEYGIKTTGITTLNRTTTDSTNQNQQTLKTLHKQSCVSYMAELLQARKLSFPKNKSPDMIELMTQINEIIPVPTIGGCTNHKRINGRPDDLFMALLHTINISGKYFHWYEENQV